MSDDHTEEDLPLGTLPLDAWHRGKGARMVPFAGYEMPIQYEGIVAEHSWTRESASLFDVSHMGQLAVHGDAEDKDEAVVQAATALEELLPGLMVRILRKCGRAARYPWSLMATSTFL